MKYKRIGVGLDRNMRNDINYNFDRMEDDIEGVKGVADNVVGIANEAKTTANNAEIKAGEAKITAETVQGQFDQVVAEAGSNNPEVVQARGSYVNLNKRLDETELTISGKLDDSDLEVERAKIRDINQNLDSVAQQLADTVTQVNGVKPVGGVIELPMPEIDTSELATKVELQAIASGSPKGTYDTVLELESAHPMGNDNIYIITTGEKSGHWYYWDVTWKDGGLYQSAGIAENAVSPKETTFLKPDKRNLFNPDTVTDGYRLGVNGELLAQAISTISDFFPVIIGKEYIIVTGTTGGDVTGRVIQYDTSKVFASVISTGLTSKNTFMATADGFVRVPVPLSNKYTTQITEVANYGGVFVPFGYTADKNIKISTIDNDIIVANNLKKDFRYRGLISIPNLNTLLNDGTYLITGGGENRPAEVTDSTSYLEVTRVGDTVIQDFMQYTALKQRKIFRRFIRANVNDFGAWFLLNRDEDQGANYLENKKIVLMGDSITGGSGYYLQLIKRLRANVINCGFGGTRMTYHTDPNFDKFSFTKLVDAKIANNFTEQDIAAGNIQVTNMPANLANLKATDFSTVDYLTIWFGTNDFSGDIYLGEDGSEDTTTLKGALQYGIRRLLEAYPQLKIIVITPMFRTVGSGNSDDTTNTYRQLYLNDYVKAIEEVANNNHVPCLNMYKESGINKFNHTRYLSDGLHPYLEKGYVHVGNKISSFISSNF